MSDSDTIKFQFRDMAEVHRTIAIATAEHWQGTLSASMLSIHIENGTIMSHEFTPYVWKVNKIRPPKRIMPDTWLTSPYTPRFAPNAKLP